MSCSVSSRLSWSPVSVKPSELPWSRWPSNWEACSTPHPPAGGTAASWPGTTGKHTTEERRIRKTVGAMDVFVMLRKMFHQHDCVRHMILQHRMWPPDQTESYSIFLIHRIYKRDICRTDRPPPTACKVTYDFSNQEEIILVFFSHTLEKQFTLLSTSTPLQFRGKYFTFFTPLRLFNNFSC